MVIVAIFTSLTTSEVDYAMYVHDRTQRANYTLGSTISQLIFLTVN